MKLWSNYLQHRGNQRISLYKASLQSIQKCAKMTVSQTLSAQPPPIPSLPHVNIWYKKVRLAKPAMPRKEETLRFQPEPPSYGCRPIFLLPQPVQRDRQLCFLQWWVLTSSDQLFSHIFFDSAGNKKFRTRAVTRAMAAWNKRGKRRQLWIIPGKKQSRNNFILLVKIQLYLTILNEYNSISQTQGIQMERGTRSS